MTMSLAAPWSDTRLSYRTERLLTAGALVFGPSAAVLAGAQPTGSVRDAVLVALGVVAVILAATAAPRWAVVVFAGVSAFAAADLSAVILGCAAVGVAFAGHRRHRDDTALQSVAAALASNALLRSELDGFFGLSAIIGIGVSTALIVAALIVQERVVRRRLLMGLAGLLSLVVLAGAGAAVQAKNSAGDIDEAISSARAASAALEAGELERAAELLDDAATALNRSHSRLDSWSARPARALPIVAQHLRVGTELSEAAAAAIDRAGATIRLLSPDRLAVVDGRIDVDALVALDAPMAALVDHVETVRASLVRLDSDWLVPGVRTKLAEASAELDERQPTIQSGLEAVRLAPQFLGANGDRRYLLLFTTPAELRGTGGFIGNYAELTIADGQLSIGDFARRSDLEDEARARGLDCGDCPAELLTQYGRFGFSNGPAGAADPRVWSNLTMPAHFPDVAEAARILYPQSGGQPIDGVITVDPFVLQALMNYTGPAQLTDPAITVQPEAAAQYILRDQYLIGDDARDQRIDGLDQLATQVMDALLGGALPDPATLIHDLAPLVAEGRMQFWTFDTDEQAVLRDVGVSGALPEPDGGSIGVTINNAAANKIDVYLDRDIETSTRTAGDGSIELVTDVRLANKAPADGLPDYVIGNEIDAPRGTNRAMVTFYMPEGPVAVEVDGNPSTLEAGHEAGWATRRHFVELRPGQTVHYRVVVPIDGRGELASGPAWLQPLSER